MNLRPKYSLRLFLIFATAVTVFLGYSQIRRKQILKMCAELQREGYHFQTPNQLRDLLWQRKPYLGSLIRNGNDRRLTSLIDGGKIPHLHSSPISEEDEATLLELGVVDREPLLPR